jgi:hypothetical protein
VVGVAWTGACVAAPDGEGVCGAAAAGGVACVAGAGGGGVDITGGGVEVCARRATRRREAGI